jgi:hypothetical protein
LNTTSDARKECEQKAKLTLILLRQQQLPSESVVDGSTVIASDSTKGQRHGGAIALVVVKV